MTVGSNYAIAIAIATLNDWLKSNASFSTNEKQNQNQWPPTLYARFFPRFEQATGNC